MMKKVIVFGAGEVGVRAKKEIEKTGAQVLCFLDNNEERWGELFDGVPVCCPESIGKLQYDKVAIGVYKAIDAITKQLVGYGVSKDRITVPIEPSRIFPSGLFEKKSNRSDNHILFMELGGQGVKENEPNLKIDFGNHFWGFIHCLEECEGQGENVEKSYRDAKELPLRLEILSIDVRSCKTKEDVEACKGRLGHGAEWMCLESSWIYRMLANEESIRFWKTRYPRGVEQNLIARLDEVKDELTKNNVPLEEICIVGSTVLQLYGILPCKKRDDVDIIMTERLRDIYGTGLVIVSEHVEIHPQNELDVEDGEIIRNEEHYFLFRGLKVLSLQDFYRNRKQTAEEDAKLVEYFLRS